MENKKHIRYIILLICVCWLSFYAYGQSGGLSGTSLVLNGQEYTYTLDVTPSVNIRWMLVNGGNSTIIGSSNTQVTVLWDSPQSGAGVMAVTDIVGTIAAMYVQLINPLSLTVNATSLSAMYGTSTYLPTYTVTGGSQDFVHYPLSYQWQRSTDGMNWVDFTLPANYTTGTIIQTTYFRVRAMQNVGTLLYSNYSNTITVEVLSPLIAGQIGSPSGGAIPYNTSPGILTVSAASGGVGNPRYSWQISVDNINWDSIPNATGLSYTSPNLQTTTWFRVKVTDTYSSVYSNTVTIAVGGSTFAISPSNPSFNQNYTAEWALTAPLNDVSALGNSPLSDAKLTVQYFDGLGRPIETVRKQGSLITSSAMANDLITTIGYDSYGRQTVQGLPYVADGSNPVDNGGVASDQTTFSGEGGYDANSAANRLNFYNSNNPNSPLVGQGENGANAYNQAVYENSPLNRILGSLAPGNSWMGAGRGIQRGYWMNTAIDAVKIWAIGLPSTLSTTFMTPVSIGNYSAGTLYKTITTDEAGHQVIEFKDMQGRMILKKVQNTAAADSGTGSSHAGWLCAYYIYDDVNNLRCVIQPQGVQTMNTANSWVLTTTLLNEQCFRYEYDQRNRMIMKQVPGAGAVYMVYDLEDKLVMTQDADLRAKNSWIVTRYDNLNRADTTWLDSLPSTTFTTLLTAAAATSTYPTTAPTPANLLTVTHYDDYTGVTFPAGVSGTYKSTWSNYYQNSTSFPYPVTPVQITATTTPVNTKGLVTWTQVRVLNSNPVVFITTVNIYDNKGRIIQTQSNNITGGANINTTQYSWAGQPLVNICWQSKKNTKPDTSITVTQMTYDYLNRVVKTEMKQSNSRVNAGAMPAAFTTVSTVEYDALGQVKKKYLGNQRSSATTYNGHPLETQVYDYNIRGWLLGMNRAFLKDGASTDSLSGAAQPTISGESFTDETVTYPNSNYFGFELGYDKAPYFGGTWGGLQYTGNISGTIWKNAYDKKVRKYDYTYDPVNRLIDAEYGQYGPGGFNVYTNFTADATYDANGNIRTMDQYITGNRPIDALTYNYISGSNKLLNVIDAANDPNTTLGDFHYPATTKTAATVDYTYDANGNMITDANKSLSIAYNYLNLPQVITVTGKGNISYIYDAAGNKLEKITTEGSKITTTLYLGNSVYRNDTLQFFGTSEGRVRVSSIQEGRAIVTNFVCDYFLKDHLGNTRMVITDDYNVASPILEATSYYPFGLQMAGISLEASGSLVNKHRFFGKEIQEKEFSDGSGLDWYDYGMREYNQQIGRFFRIDPISDKFYDLSPYQFCSDDPIKNVDLDGAEGLDFRIYSQLVQNTVQNPNGTSAKILGAVSGIGGSVYGAINGLAHPGQALKGLGHMLSQSPAQNAVDYGMNLYSQYGNSGSDAFTESAMVSHALTDVAIALSPLKEGGLAKEGALTSNAFEGLTSITDIGKTGEALTKGVLQSQFKGAEILEQVGIKMDGATMNADFVVVQDGKVTGVFESKVNGSKLSNGQKLFFNDKDAGTLSGKNVPEALKGTTVDPSKLQTGVYRWDSKTSSFTLQ